MTDVVVLYPRVVSLDQVYSCVVHHTDHGHAEVDSLEEDVGVGEAAHVGDHEPGGPPPRWT